MSAIDSAADHRPPCPAGARVRRRRAGGGAAALTAALAALLALSAVGCWAASSEVSVTAVVGKVEHRTSSKGAWARTKVGTRLKPGSQLQTSGSSKAEMKFPDGTTFRLGPQSLITIAQAAKPSAKLAKGSVFGQIVKGSLVRVQGRYGTATVRGTDILYNTSGGGDTLRVWGGQADYSSSGGTQQLSDGMGSMLGADGIPSAPGMVAPEQFTGVSFLPYFEQFQSGAELTATVGTPALQTDLDLRGPVIEDIIGLEPTRTGLVDVVVEQVNAEGLGAMAGAGGIGGWTGIPALALGAADSLSSTQRSLESQIGHGVFGPVSSVSVYGAVGNGASFGGARAGLSAVAGNLYLQASGRYSFATHEVPEWLLDESFIASRTSSSDLTLGRFRLFESPVSNTDRASLLPVSVCDGVRYNQWLGSQWRISAAWLGNFDPLLEEDQDGWFGRVQYYDNGHWLGAAALCQTDAQTGVVGQFGWSLGYDLELYGEVGSDTRGRSLCNLGLSFPELLYGHDLSLRIERASREGYDPLTGVHAYWGVGGGSWLLGAADVTDDGDWGFALGYFVSFGGSR